MEQDDDNKSILNDGIGVNKDLTESNRDIGISSSAEKDDFNKETDEFSMEPRDEARKFKSQKSGSIFGEIVESVAIAVILAFVIRMFLFQPFYIPSGSMEPTLKPGDRIIVNKFLYHFTDIKRGEIIVFKYPRDPNRDFIKRVIGLPGETIEIKNNEVYINGEKIPQPYLPKGIRMPEYGPVDIPEDSFFMMGDNRNNSEDSRVWGTLPRENIIGKAFVIYWPLPRLDSIK